MKGKKPAEMTNEELLKHEKTAKVVTYMFLGAVVVLIALAVYNTVKNGFSAVSMMPCGFLPLLMVILGNLSTITKVKKERGLK